MELGINSYDIILERGCIHKLTQYIDVNRKVMIISDDGVPNEHIQVVMSQLPQGYVHIVKQGEGSKSLNVFEELCVNLLEHQFSRKDLIIALGGGVVGDLSGYVAACYMRGIDFVQIPTTTLSQIDSSIGGKVAINLHDVKNIIGAFYQPKKVLIDPDTLSTLPRRHYINGLVEALKAGLIYDASLFELFESNEIDQNIDLIIAKALQVKKAVVEQDEKEQGLRKILNFGHTIGHAIETSYHLHDFYHGECVALGMLYFISDASLSKRVRRIYQTLGLQEAVPVKVEEWLQIMRNDKKADQHEVDTIWVNTVGHAEIKKMTFDEVRELMESAQ